MHTALSERGIWGLDTRDGHPEALVLEQVASMIRGGGNGAYKRFEVVRGAESR
jgi:hypothetical protein